MRRLIALAITGLSLAGCSGTLFPGAGTVEIGLQSTPPGADAITSLGPGCKTPCTVAVPTPTDDFAISYALKGFQPTTIPVHITRSAGSLMTPPFTSLDPNPVIAQLEPVAPPKPQRAKKPKTPQAAAQ